MSEVAPLLFTPLSLLHHEANAKMVPFAGYSMPIQYPLGILKEHLHCREAAGLFDVSHMGQIALTSKTKSIPQIAEALERLIPVDLLSLPVNRQKYGFFTNEKAGILDDLMIANLGHSLFLVVNAACKEADIAHLKVHLEPLDIQVSPILDRALLALQGPLAAEVIARLNPSVKAMQFMEIQELVIENSHLIISRSGYTGEDGFEISVQNEDAVHIARRLLEETEVEWIGLGARDSLRLECGLCLYGHDMNETITPYEASLQWAVSPSRRNGGERSGGFLGADILLTQFETKQVSSKRVGLIGETKVPVREGAKLYDADGIEIGKVSSGGFGPTFGSPIAMGYVTSQHAFVNEVVYAEVRGKKLPMRISKMPFVPQRYYRSAP